MANVKSLLIGALATIVPALTGAAIVPVPNANANTDTAVYRVRSHSQHEKEPG